jgi:hypothetical protein
MLWDYYVKSLEDFDNTWYFYVEWTDTAGPIVAIDYRGFSGEVPTLVFEFGLTREAFENEISKYHYKYDDIKFEKKRKFFFGLFG